MEDTPTPIPSANLSNVDTHLAYIRRDLSDIKNQIKNLAEGSVTRTEFNELEKHVAVIEADVQSLKNYRWFMAGAIALGAFVATILSKYIFH